MIKFENVRKTYKSGVEALKGVSFEIKDGEFVFVIGKSGSGKSTLMKCITCEEVPTGGSVIIDDFDISRMSRRLIPNLRRQLGMIYQDFRLINSKTVFENIAFAGEIIGIRKKELHQTVQLVLNVVGLKDKADAYPQELSGGEQQRVAIARAMVNNPKLVVADEPTGNLDPETSESIMALLQEINRGGATVLVCTHDSNLVDRMKKRVLEIEGGLLVRDKEGATYSDGPTAKKQAVDNPAPAYVDQGMNITFGDDPAFDHDREYNASFDDEEYAQEEVSEGFCFGDEPVVVTPDVQEPVEVLTETKSEPAPEQAQEPVVPELPAIEFPSDSLPEEVPMVEEARVDETSVEAKDSWIEEISLEDSDIDLDIQEDD